MATGWALAPAWPGLELPGKRPGKRWWRGIVAPYCGVPGPPPPPPLQGPGEQMCHVCLLGMKPVLREESWGREAARGDLVGVRWR